MYKYKRGINNLEHAKLIEFSMSNNRNLCFSTSGVLDVKKPYNGMYIKNGKVMVETFADELKVNDKLYKLAQISTLSNNYSDCEYITSINLEENTICYNIEGIIIEKRIVMCQNRDMLCIEYAIRNEIKSDIKFKISPCITYRDLFSMKNASMLKFNQRHVNDGILINLSIINDENLVIKSDCGEYIEEPNVVYDIKHEMIEKNSNVKEYNEDLLLPGYFEYDVFSGNIRKIHIYVSDTDFNINTMKFDDIYSNYIYRKGKAISCVAEEFVELRDLSMLIDYFNFEDDLISTIPYANKLEYSMSYCYEQSILKFEKDVDILTDIVRSVEGQYLIFDKLKEANKVFIKIRKYIREIDSIKIEDIDIIKEVSKLKLWYIESVNKFLQKYPSYMDFHIDFIKELLYYLFENDNTKDVIISDIEMISLSYNALKIYENIISKLKRQDKKLLEKILFIQDLIVDKYWSEDARCMKRKLSDDEVIPSVEMLYTLSLSYPCIFGEMTIKLLDTIFKEFYTPYGLREMPKSSQNNSGAIYPKYMAHFIKANLRQNGVTMASKKIAYNLVKELIQDIGKYVNGGIKMIYNDKGILVDQKCGIDLYTNAEMIRLYDMLT